MGEVWAATTETGMRVAAKVLLPGLAASPRLLRLVENEFRAVARLEHPHVIRVLGRGVAGPDQPVAEGTPWFALEYCAGGTLADQPPDSFAATCAVVVALLDALAHAHARGVLHRDLKPANVLLAAAGDHRPGWKLADFGVAHAVGAGQTRRSIAGSPAYMAPEQQVGAPVDQGPWTDLHALGVVVHELVTGTLPEDDEAGEPTARFSVPAGLWGWIAWLRDPDRARRPRTAAEAWRALHALAPEVVPPAPSGWRTPPRPQARQRLGGAALVGLVAVPFVGREAERERLWQWLGAGDGTVVSVTGPSGIGRTALLRWLAERAHETGTARVVVLDDAERPPDALARLLLAWVEQADAPAEERSARLATALAAAPPDAARVVTGLLAEPEDRWGAVPAVREVLAALVRGPTLLVLDHPGPGPQRLARALAARPVPGLRVAVGELAVGTALALAPLLPPDLEDLGRAAGELDNDAAATLARVADGHPGYALATVASWVRSGALVRGPRGLALTAAPTTGAARIEVVGSFEEAGLAGLERAAVQGLGVDEALWEDSCDAPDGPVSERLLSPTRLRARLAALAALLDRGDCVETDDGFRFVYPEVRDALVTSATRAGRLAGHHAAIAAHLVPDWLAHGGPWDADQDLAPPARFDPRWGEQALRLARHLVGAGRPRDALSPLGVAANTFVSRAPERLQEVVELFEGALLAAGIPDSHPASVRARIARAAHLIHRGRAAEALAEAREAARWADGSGLPHLRAYAHARVVDAAGSVHQLAEATASFAAIQELGDVVPLRWRVSHLGREGVARAERGDRAGAEEAWDRALALARAAPRDARLGASWCEAASWARRTDEALEVVAWALPLAVAAGETLTALFLSSKRAELLGGAERIDEAELAARETRRLAREFGAQRTELLMISLLADLALLREAWGDVAHLALEGVALSAETTHPVYEASLRVKALLAALRLGDRAGAEVHQAWLTAALGSLAPAAVAQLGQVLDQVPDPATEALRAEVRARLGA